MDTRDNPTKMEEIRDLIQSGRKKQAMKECRKFFQCDAFEAKLAVEHMEKSGVYSWRKLEKKKDPVFRVMMPLWIAILLIPIIVVGVYRTDILWPQAASYQVGVQLSNGERLLFPSSIEGAVNKKGDLLMDYEPTALADCVGLYLEPSDSWRITDTQNPFFDGEIAHIPSHHYQYSGETVYDSATSSHRTDTFTNQKGATVFSYTHEDEKRKTAAYFKMWWCTHHHGSDIPAFSLMSKNISMLIISWNKNTV